MVSVRTMMLTFAAGLAVAATAGAQNAGPRRPIELGIDAALAYEDADDVSATTLTLPVPRVRLGFFIGDALSLEPFFSIQYSRTKVDDNGPFDGETVSVTQYDLGLGLLFHFATDRARTQPYVRPFVGIRGFSASDDDENDSSGNQPILGAGIGLKFPSTNRLGTRLEAGFARRFEDDPIFDASNQIYLSFGLSFFTR